MGKNEMDGWSYTYGNRRRTSDANEVARLVDAGQYTEAISLRKLLKLAIASGDVVAQCNLGSCYAKERGFLRDDREAARWYRKAAKQGDVRALSALKRLGL